MSYWCVAFTILVLPDVIAIFWNRLEGSCLTPFMRTLIQDKNGEQEKRAAKIQIQELRP
jgi:hypothetical protein